MEIAIEDGGDILRIRVRGRLDTLTAYDFDARMEGNLPGGPRSVLLDLEAMEYISSAGIRSVLALLRRVKGSGGRMAAWGLQNLPKEVFLLTRVNELLPIFDAREEALRYLQNSDGRPSGA